MTITSDKESLVAKLLQEGRALIDAPRRRIDFKTGDHEADDHLNNLEKFPHLFVLGCIMDRQIPYGRAWVIPHKIGQQIGGFRFEHYRKLPLSKIEKMFSAGRLHRFNKVAAGHFFKAIQRIEEQYNGNAARIWSGEPSSALVIRRFLEFEGAGRKIATMAANLLVREFKIRLGDLSAIDISPDSRVTRFFKDNGLLRPDASTDELIYLARELAPDFPGLLDYGAFNAGEYKRKT